MSPNTPALAGAMLEVKGLSFGYPQAPLFDNWSLCLPPGLSWLRGGDGRGKTTLLRLLSGDLPAQAGALAVYGVLLSNAPEVYRQHVFWADPRSDAHEQRTPLDYVASLQARFALLELQTFLRLSDGLALAPHLEKPMYMLSTGSRRKVWLAAAFASMAPVILLDEPFAALDLPSITCVRAWLEGAARHATQACLVAHYEKPCAAELASVIDLGD